MKKISVVILVVVLLIIAGSAFSKSKSTSSIKIVALYPLTGGVASWGESSKQGTDLAVSEINKNGGINGRPLEIIYQDHKCDPKSALSAFERLLLQSHIFISSSCSGTVLSIAPKLQNQDALLLATVVASVKLSGVSPLLFRNWAVETQQAELIGQKIKDAGYKKIGVLYEETDYAKGLNLALQRFLQGTPVTFVEESFAPNTTDLRTQLTKLKSANLDVLFISPQSEASSEVIFAQMGQLKFKPRVFVNDIILGATGLLEKHASSLEGALGGNLLVQSDKLEAFTEALKAYSNNDCIHLNACAVAYDSIYVLAEAFKKKGESAKGVQTYLEGISYNGVSGRTAFDQNHDRKGASYTLSVVKSGKVYVANQ